MVTRLLLYFLGGVVVAVALSLAEPPHALERAAPWWILGPPALLGLRLRGRALLLAAFACGMLLGGLRAHAAGERLQRVEVFDRDLPEEGMWSGTILEGSRPAIGLGRAVFRVEQVHAGASIVRLDAVFTLARVEGERALVRGDRIAIRARLLPDRGAMHPWAWDPRLGRRVRGRRGVLVARDVPIVIGESASIARSIDAFRLRVERALFAGLSDETAGIAAAMVTGTRDRIEPSTRSLFADTGAAHVLAVSGMHLALLSAAGFGLIDHALRWVPGLAARWVTRRIAAWFMLPLVAAYVVFTGAPASALRAGIMAGIVFFAVGIGRPSLSLHGLAVATLVLVLAHPLWLVDMGFQLSVTATLALVVYEPPRPRARSRPGGSRLRAAVGRVWEGLLGSLRVSVAASFGTLPALLWHVGSVPLASPLTNLMVVPPLALVALPLSCVAALLEIAGLWGAKPLFWIIERAVVLSVAVGERFAWLLTWAWTWGRPSALGMIGLVALVGAWWAWSLGRWRASAAACGVAAVLLGTDVPSGWRATGELTIHAIPVGQGDCTLVELPDGTALLLDAGPEGALERHVLPYLRGIGRARVDRVVLSHADLDHVGSLADQLHALRPGRIDLSLPERDRPAAVRLRQAARVAGAEVVVHEQAWNAEEVGGARLEYLVAPDAAPGNDGGLVLRVCHGAVCFLAVGDAEEELERAMVLGGHPVRAEVLKVGHHGSATSSGELFLDAVRPRVALIHAGRGNRFGFPSAEVEARLRRRGVLRFDTMRGCVPIVRTTGGGRAFRAWESCGTAGPSSGPR